MRLICTHCRTKSADLNDNGSIVKYEPCCLNAREALSKIVDDLVQGSPDYAKWYEKIDGNQSEVEPSFYDWELNR